MKVFVFGWYGQGNLGDEAFKESFIKLWPNNKFTFSNSIPTNINEIYDACWIGGGSFLEQHIPNLEYVNIPISFFGVGSSLSPSSSVRGALEKAEHIVFRDKTAAECWPKAKVLSDLVFAREDLIPLPMAKKKQVTIFLNDFLTPFGKVMEWKALSYYWYLQEFTKIIDRLSATHKIVLFPMCINHRVDDRRIAGSLIGRSEFPHRYEWILEHQDEYTLRKCIQESEFVITQRFHGLVYSLIAEVPCVTITAHDKFASLCRHLQLPLVDFYGITDASFGKAMGDLGSFMSDRVIEYRKESILKWKTMADLVNGF